jgi:hypothetical protein
MEEFLPILIGIIWLAYTLYTKGQKKGKLKMQQPAEKKESKSPSILEQILMGEPFQQPQPYETNNMEDSTLSEIFEKVESKPRIKKQSPFLQEELSQFKQEGQRGIISDEMDLTVQDLIHETAIKERDFDLRSAVIYSEILNTPYISYK